MSTRHLLHLSSLTKEKMFVRLFWSNLKEIPKTTFVLFHSNEMVIDSMASEKIDFRVRSKIWIENSNGKVIFGLGRYRMLDAVQRLGSMNAAAKELGMSYRAIWMRIRSSEKRIGQRLIVRDGKGSSLTPFAENLMKQYRRLHAVVQAETDEVYKRLIPEYLNSKQ